MKSMFFGGYLLDCIVLEKALIPCPRRYIVCRNIVGKGQVQHEKWDELRTILINGQEKWQQKFVY